MFILSVKRAERSLPSGKFFAHLSLQMHILFHRTFPLGGSLMQPMPDMTALLKIAQSPAGQKLLAMLKDNSWDHSAQAYFELYKKTSAS